MQPKPPSIHPLDWQQAALVAKQHHCFPGLLPGSCSSCGRRMEGRNLGDRAAENPIKNKGQEDIISFHRYNCFKFEEPLTSTCQKSPFIFLFNY
jgi:hypothetical protein